MRSAAVPPAPTSAVGPFPARRCVAQALRFLGFTLGLAASCAVVLLATTIVTPSMVAASAVAGLGLIVALALGLDVLGLRTLRALLTALALSEGTFWAWVGQRVGMDLLLTALVVGGAVFAGAGAYGLRSRLGLGAWAPYLFGVLLGLLLAWGLVVVTGASALAVWLSVQGLLLFAAYTAHDLHDVRARAAACTSEDELERLALGSSISLYLDVANLVADAADVLASAGRDAAEAAWGVLRAVGDLVGALLGVVRRVLGAVGDVLGGL